MLSLKKSFALSTLLATAVLAGCQSQSNTLNFNTPAPTATFNVQNQYAAVNVITQDQRPSAEVASYVNSGNIQRLNAVPSVSQLFQQIMQQNLNSKGFSLVSGVANANVVVNVKKFFAQVEQGNLRYKISADVGVEVIVQAPKGTYTKNFNANRGYEGAFSAKNDEIQKVLNQAYEDVVKAIYNDNEIGNAIHQYQ